MVTSVNVFAYAPALAAQAPKRVGRATSRLHATAGGALALLLLGLVPFPATRASEVAAARARNPLIGTWLLVRYVDVPEGDEPIFAFGKEPIGQFIFTAGMHVSFSIMRNPPDPGTPTSDPDPDACIPGWYCAYFGTYSVDTTKGIWVTHVLSANIPGFLNTEQPRHFTIHGDTLVVAETYFQGSRRISAERVFVREKVPSPR